MVRIPRALKASLAIFLVAAPVGVVYAAGGDAPPEHLAPTPVEAPILVPAPQAGAPEAPFAVPASAPAGEPPVARDYGGIVLAEYAHTFDEAPATGVLDLRIDQGSIRVIGWDAPQYLVQVLQDPGPAPLFGEPETHVTFTDASHDGVLELEMIVDEKAAIGAGVRAGPDLAGLRIDDGGPTNAIVAYVPMATAFDSIFICSGQAEFISLPLFGDGAPQQGDCLADEAAADPLVAASDGSAEAAPLTVLMGIENVHGTHAGIVAEVVDPELIDVSFETVDVVSGMEDIVGSGVEIGTLRASQLYGDVIIQGAIDNAEITSDSGDISLELEPRATGVLALSAEYGDVTVLVPKGADAAYDVQAATEYGEVTVNLEGVDVATKDPNATEEDPGAIVNAHTPGFETAALQVVFNIGTEYGDIVVTDGTILPHAHDDAGDRVGAEAPAPEAGHWSPFEALPAVPSLPTLPPLP